jgi:hypothetical protein
MEILLAAQHRHGRARRSTLAYRSGGAHGGAPRSTASARPGQARLVILATLGALALAGGPATARAHPQTSPDRNNRYLKLTPMADRLRIAYTVYLGEAPGAHARRRLDRDRDGTVSDGEASVIAREIAAMVTPAVDLALDDRAVTIDWSAPTIGLGTPATAGGALAIDLVGWVCTGPGPRHRLALRDRVRIDAPGEIEVRLEDGPGIDFPADARRLAGEPMRELTVTWRGDEERLTRGLEAAYTVDATRALRLTDRRCAPPRPGGGGRPLVYVGAALAGLALGVTALVLTRRRRR